MSDEEQRVPETVVAPSVASPGVDEPRNEAEASKKKLGFIGRFFRVKLIIALLVLGAILAVLMTVALGPLLKGTIEERGSRALGAKVSMDSLSINLLTSSVRITNLHLADPKSPKQNMFQAGEIAASVAFLPLLSGRLVVKELLLDEPRADVERAEDGSFNVMEPAAEKDRRARGLSEEERESELETARKLAKQRDWVKEIGRLLEWLRERRARKAKEVAAAPADTPRQKPGRYGTVVEVPEHKEETPRLFIKIAEARNLQIALRDHTRDAEAPSLQKVNIKITDLALSPRLGPEPANVKLTGQIGDDSSSTIDIELIADLRQSQDPGRGSLSVKLRSFPLAAYAPMYAESWPVDFRDGTADLSATFRMSGEEIVEGKVSTTVDKVSVAGKPGKKKVLGMRPAELDRVLRTAMPMAVEFTVGGKYYAPKTDLPQAIARALKDKGADIAESFVREKVDAEVEKGKEKLREELGKSLGEKGSKALDSILGNSKKSENERKREPETDPKKSGGALKDLKDLEKLKDLF